MSSSSNETTGALFIFGGLLGLAACLGYQAFHFLKFGSWPEVSSADVLHRLGVIGQSWYMNPKDWIGVHAVLSFVNAGALALLIGWGIGFAALASD